MSELTTIEADPNSSSSRGRLQADTAEPSSSLPFIHALQYCDGCGTAPIIGTCFRAVNLDNYDLCEACMERYRGREEFRPFTLELCIPLQEQWQWDYQHYGRVLVPFLCFDHWVQCVNCVNEGQKTTLKQQFELASSLYIEALRILPEEEWMNVDDLIQMIQSMPIDNLESLVSWTGIHVGWFLRVFCSSPYLKRLIDFGCETWFIRKVCVIEMLWRSNHDVENKNEMKESPLALGTFVNHIDSVVRHWALEHEDVDDKRIAIVAKPTMFISYTGAYTLKHVVQVLHGLDENEYIWLDIFCVNQFAWTGRGRSDEMSKFRDLFMADLQNQIQSIGSTSLILEQWDNVMLTLGQIWVLWEIFNTANAPNVAFQVLLPPRQVNDFIQSCLEHTDKFEMIQRSLAAIDANNANAEDDTDRKSILAHMQSCGLGYVNAMVIKVMRRWLAHEGQLYLAQQRKLPDGPSPLLLDRMGTLFQDQGNYQDAELLLRESLEKQRERFGDHHAETFSAMSNGLEGTRETF